jgi:Tol biopolymer transport system component
MKLHLALALSLVLTVLFGSRGHTAQAPQPASALAKPSVSAAGGSYSPQFSADGRFLIFTSHAPNLTTNENDQGFLNIYYREMSSGQITLISVRGAGDRPGNNSSSSPSVSSNGQFIAFESDASDLVPGDTNGFKDIFLRDTASGATTLVSVNASGVGGGNGVSSNPTISPDGRYILFESSAENLVPDDTNRITDLFLRDRLAGTTTLISVGAQGPPGSPFGSFTRSGSASMSADGTRVVFVSTATNLVPGVGSSLGEVYVRDLTTGRTSWASSNSVAIASGPWRSFNPVITPDGHYIVFKTLISPQPVTVYLTLQDLQTGKLTVVTDRADTLGWPSISGDGSKIASESNPQSIAIWNTADVTNSPILFPITNAGFGPILSPDGRRMAILSAASSGVTNTLFGTVQLFIVDLPSGEIRLASINLNRTGSADLSGTHPSLDNTGNLLAFESPDGSLVPGDDKQFSDVFVYNWTSDSVQLISKALPTRPNITLSGFSVSGSAGVSANGRYVAFSTSQTNIYTPPPTNAFNFAVWDTWLNTNIVLNTLTNRTVSDGGSLPATNTIRTKVIAAGPVISLDGTILVYMVPTSTSYGLFGFAQIRALNLITGNSYLVDNSLTSPNSLFRSTLPSTDASHELIAYQSDGNNFPTGVPDGYFSPDIFVFDLKLRTNRLVSVNALGTAAANGNSGNPLISPDGRWVLFQSVASDLVNGISNYPAATSQEFVRDLVTSNTYLLSFGSSGLPLSGVATSHVFSLDSHLAAFGGRFDFGDGSGPLLSISISDLFSKTNRVICTNCQNPSLDASGRWAVYERLPSASGTADVFIQDLQSGQQTRISSDPTGLNGGNGPSVNPLISSDARYVVFASKASNLVNNDNNNAFDVFVRDRVLGKTTLLSLSRDGTHSANAGSARPALSADGRTVVFQSLATDMSEGDFNRKRDTFVVRLGSGDSDQDGMDDDWELAYFNTLGRDGQGDFDGDGKTDLEEFRAGTDPTNSGSILRVLSLNKIGSGDVTLLWNSIPGKTYRLQYKNTLDAASWQNFPGTVTAISETTVAQDSAPVPNRFYRVITVD